MIFPEQSNPRVMNLKEDKQYNKYRNNFYAAFLRFEFGGFYRLCFDYFSRNSSFFPMIKKSFCMNLFSF